MTEVKRLAKLFFSQVSDEALKELHSAVYQEVKVRMEKRIENGEYQQPLPEELVGSRITAIMNYRNRTNEDLVVSKAVIEKFWPKET